jgi:biotin operon repressor
MRFAVALAGAILLAKGAINEAEAGTTLHMSRATLTRLISDLRRAGMVIHRHRGRLLADRAASSWWPDPSLPGANIPLASCEICGVHLTRPHALTCSAACARARRGRLANTRKAAGATRDAIHDLTILIEDSNA